MNSRLLISFTGFFLLVLLLFLLINMPVRQLLRFVELSDQINLQGVEGTLFSGTVKRLTVQDFAFSDINYVQNPLCLFLASSCVTVADLEGTKLDITYHWFSGSAKLQNSQISAPLNQFASVFKNSMVKPQGDLLLQLQQVEWVSQKVTGLQSSIFWNNAAVQGESLALGSYKLDVSQSEQGLALVLSDVEGPMQMQGDGELALSGQLQVDLNIKLRTDAPEKLSSMLSLFMKQQGLGSYSLKSEYKLPADVRRYLTIFAEE